MCVIKPFSSLRPAPEVVANVATHSIDRYSKEQIKNILASNPVSFLQVIHHKEGSAHSTADRFLSIKKRFKDFVANKIFIQDPSPCFYIYRQIKNSRHHTGIIGLASIDDYSKNRIKVHEQTLAQREERLMDYLDKTDLNVEPVCLTYPHHKGLNDLMQAKTKEIPVYDYTADGIRHTVWVISNQVEIEKIHTMFSEVPVIYIADGHHRASSSALLAKKRTAENPNHTGNEPYNFFTAALFADDELKIYGYHRIIQGLNQYSPDSFIIELRKKFNVYEIEKAPENIRKKTLTLYTGKKWYCIDLSNHITNPNDTVSKLDVSLLSDYILSPILGIKDIRNDKRISFVSGTKSTEEIEKIVDNGNLDAAFCLSPISFEELITVADMGEVMPPKSTWIEPKLESGLLTYSIEE